MELKIGERVRAWDDDAGQWREGHIESFPSETKVSVLVELEHPYRYPTLETIDVPNDPEFVQVLTKLSR